MLRRMRLLLDNPEMIYSRQSTRNAFLLTLLGFPLVTNTNCNKGLSNLEDSLYLIAFDSTTSVTVTRLRFHWPLNIYMYVYMYLPLPLLLCMSVFI